MDEIALQAITSLDPQAVADAPRRCMDLGLGNGDPLTMCSEGAVMSALMAATELGANKATVLTYANSGDVPIGERDQVVGYGAVALWQAGAEAAPSESGTAGTFALSLPPAPPGEPIELSPEQQEVLLALARDTAREFLASETIPPFETDEPALLQPMGAYVTYETVDRARKETTLRGCLGRIEGDRPAYLNVQYAAVAAAVADPRFPAITPPELETLTLEITLLEPKRPVNSPEEIQIGRDGVMMRAAGQTGALFLPQVPTDQGWDLEDTLVQLCRKAGLPDDAWQDPDTRFYVFEGQWFGGE
jgi:AmmeMemoRadiSam system protein A